MKKLFSIALMAIVALTVQAQNVQVHYDFGRNIYGDEQPDRQKVTVTLEQFKADDWGSWFYFVDIDLSRKFLRSAYTEISREFNLGTNSPFAAHVEYDGGLYHVTGSYQHAALIGPAYHSFQLTGVWSTTFAQKKCTFSGFIDFWRGEKADGHGQLVILSEPQFWYNVTDHFSIGSEVEFSNNFVFNMKPGSDQTFFVNPTLAVKWNF